VRWTTALLPTPRRRSGSSHCASRGGRARLRVATGPDRGTPELFFRADDKYTCVRTAGGEHLIRTPLAELVAQLDAQQALRNVPLTQLNPRHSLCSIVHRPQMAARVNLNHIV
jgi:hypothetical protein